MKTILIIVLVMVLMAGTAFFITKQFLLPKTGETAAETDKHEESKSKDDHGEEEPGHVHLVSDLLVNPTGTGGTRYLSTSVGLEVGTPEELAELEARDIQVRDILISILSSKTVDQLTDFKEREKLRNEIRTRLNQMLGKEDLTAVYFVNYVLQ